MGKDSLCSARIDVVVKWLGRELTWNECKGPGLIMGFGFLSFYYKHLLLNNSLNGVALSPEGNICLTYIRQYRCFKKHPHNIFCQQTGIQQAIEF